MILSFAEFNALYESYNDSYEDSLEYSDGAEVLEALFTVMQKQGSLTEREVATFLDNVLDEIEYDLNTDIYESYLDWLEEYAHILDESYNEDAGYTYSLTRRGELMLSEGTMDKLKGFGSTLKSNFSGGANAKGKGVVRNTLAGVKGALGTKIGSVGGANIKLGHAVGGAAALGGGVLAARALVKKHQAKKAAAAAPPAPAPAPAR